MNKQLLIGNLGKDPEVKATQNGKKVATFSLATSEKRGGEEQTTWHNLVLWEKLADLAEQYLKKGSKIYAEGRTVHRSYQDKDGQTKYITEVVVSEMKFLGGNKAEGQQGNYTGGTQKAEAQPVGFGGTDTEDDLPF
jgi:single-strand DNA-binding protein